LHRYEEIATPATKLGGIAMTFYEVSITSGQFLHINEIRRSEVTPMVFRQLLKLVI
jgi:hypothetical protein